MKNLSIKFFPHLLLLLIVGIVFKSWFLPGLISSGDILYYSHLLYQNWTISQYAWSPYLTAGFGGFAGSLLWVGFNFSIPITIFGKFLGLNWNLIERIYYLFPFLLVTLFSSAFLFKKLIANNYFYLFSTSIFLFNTYILMVIGGGQIGGIGMAYALLPLVLYAFIRINKALKEKNNFRVIVTSLLAGLIFSAQAIFDIRIAYVTISAIVIYWILKLIENRNLKYLIRSLFFLLTLPILCSFFLHAFWIIPTVILGKNPVETLGSAYSSQEAVKFFSFAKLENSISLLHPNWPENIFGKTYFMKSEFLFLPILAFSALLFIKNETKERRGYLIFFSILGLLGAFLGKGANEPFGQIYLWLFERFPGFVLFRDSSKWYTLTAISYSVFIPYSILRIYELLKSRPQFQIKPKYQILNFQNLFLLLVAFYLLFLIHPALLGSLSGTFKSTQIPQEYIKFEKFLSSQNEFFRTLWVPTHQRFSYYSAKHPAVPAQDYFKTVNYSQVLKYLRMPNGEKTLQDAGIKYLVIPYDSQGEIFLKDRKYDDALYEKTINELRKISYLKQVEGFGKIAVFEVEKPKDHFYFSNQQQVASNQRLEYQYISPVEYEVNVQNAKNGDILVFSESFDKGWVLKSSMFKIQSLKFNNSFNSFALKEGNYSARVHYEPQKWVNIGSVVSIISLIFILMVLGLGFVYKK